MTNDNGFASLLDGLKLQIALLKRRCIDDEAEISALREANGRQQERIAELEKKETELAEKYRSLRAGTLQGASAEEVENLRNRYLAMIREIDLCLDKLNG